MLLKWYIEEETKELREAFEKEISQWPQVDYKKLFGCPCYLANGKMFAGLVTKGIIITKLSDKEKEELKKLKKTKPFKAGKKTIKSWVNIDLDPNELNDIIPYIKKSYDRAIESGK
jgi:TfoX/Sxy family transcriptional regulator of competence genes